jgi:hypothetical protein
LHFCTFFIAFALHYDHAWADSLFPAYFHGWPASTWLADGRPKQTVGWLAPGKQENVTVTSRCTAVHPSAIPFDPPSCVKK